MEIDEVVRKLKKLAKSAKPGYKEGMARFGIVSKTALGISMPDLRVLAKEIGKDHELALKLWILDIHEAKLLACLTDNWKQVTEHQMDSWVEDFYSWDICDQCCSNLFDKTPFYQKKIREWVKSEKEFVRRAGFVLMATSAVHDKGAPDSQFLTYLPLIEKYASDERNFVKKAVNWALRQIGKRNLRLHKEALKAAKKLRESESKSSRWIGSDAYRELEDREVIERIKKKSTKR
jgi:3-methyladenine DNA glycosylase AlkD